MYIDGYPHLCRALDVSETGLLLERMNEPSTNIEYFPIEIGWFDPERAQAPERLWVWTQQVRIDGDRQALRFVGLAESDRRKLVRMVRRARVRHHRVV